MVKVKERTIWQGKVGIRDKYLVMCRDQHEGLEITCNDEVMQIPYEEITKKIVGKSEKSFFDRFSRASHYLVYFDWKPNIKKPKQQSLI